MPTPRTARPCSAPDPIRARALPLGRITAKRTANGRAGLSSRLPATALTTAPIGITILPQILRSVRYAPVTVGQPGGSHLQALTDGA